MADCCAVGRCCLYFELRTGIRIYSVCSMIAAIAVTSNVKNIIVIDVENGTLPFVPGLGRDFLFDPEDEDPKIRDWNIYFSTVVSLFLIFSGLNFVTALSLLLVTNMRRKRSWLLPWMCAKAAEILVVSAMLLAAPGLYSKHSLWKAAFSEPHLRWTVSSWILATAYLALQAYMWLAVRSFYRDLEGCSVVVPSHANAVIAPSIMEMEYRRHAPPGFGQLPPAYAEKPTTGERRAMAKMDIPSVEEILPTIDQPAAKSKRHYY